MPTSPAARSRADRLSVVRLRPAEADEPFAATVRRGLTHDPKFLLCRYIYDAIGSELFEQICDQPEYYLTRTEDAILRDRAAAIVDGWPEAPTMIELGSGSSTKTRRLIEAALEAYGSLHYVPIDVSPTILEESAHALVDDYPNLRVTGLATDYHTALRVVRERFPGPKLVVFLGSSLGNFDDDDAAGLLREVAATLTPADRFVFGTDLVKDAPTLEAAYDDTAGVTRRFNKNILTRINRELGADFDPVRFDYRARFVPDRHRVEMHLVSLADQRVRIPGAEIEVDFAAGETIHTENSHKYTPTILERLAAQAGFVEDDRWTDPDGLFRVQRWRLRG